MFTSYSQVKCLVSDPVNAGTNSETRPAKHWSLSFMPDHDTAPLFPYINGAMADALWYEHPDHVRFTLDGIRCLLYPRRWAAHFFEDRCDAMAFIPRLLSTIRQIHGQTGTIQPNFSQIRRINIPDLLALLPRTNCRDCGYATCMAFAGAVRLGKASADACPGLGAPMSVSAAYPIFDRNGDLVDALHLNIDTQGLEKKIREQEGRIQRLEAELNQVRSAAEASPARPLEIPPLQPLPQSPRPSDEWPEEIPGGALTQREIEVLAQIARGYTNNEIAGLLFISPHTVKSHMINIFNKLSVSDRTLAAVTAVRKGLI